MFPHGVSAVSALAKLSAVTTMGDDPAFCSFQSNAVKIWDVLKSKSGPGRMKKAV